MIADLADRCIAKGSSMTITAHRRRLIKQLAERCMGQGVRYHVEMAALPDEPWARVDSQAEIIIGSKDTMLSNAKRGASPKRTKVAIVDEAHTLDNPAYLALVNSIEPEWLIGPTATPCRNDGSGFGPKMFTEIVWSTSIEDLIAQDYLMRMEAYCPIGAARRRREGLKAGVIGDPVRQWIDHAAGLRTITFCRTLAECRTVRDMFLAEMVPTEYLDAKTPDEERDDAIDRLAKGETKVITCTAALMGVGVDIPAVECVQCLVKNISPRAFWQTCGRAQRKSPGKIRAVLIDHSGAVFEHGLPNYSPLWTLGTNDSVQMRQMDRMAEDVLVRPVVCNACGTIAAGQRCPNCNTLLVSHRKRRTPTERGNLDAVDALDPHDVRQEEWRKFIRIGCAKGFTTVVAAKMFKSKFGVWPDKANVLPRWGFWCSRKLCAVEYPDYVRVPSV
jgi:DNA repair protein RadD